MPLKFPEDVYFGGNVEFKYGVPRSLLTQENLVAHALPFTEWRVWDAFATTLPGTSATDDLGLYAGAFATGCPYVGTGDVKTLTATRYARIAYQLPAHYIAGQRVQVRLTAGMITTVAGTSCTVDVEAYKFAGDTLKTGSDLCATAAQSINSLTFADKDFTITGTGLSPGDWLDIRIAIASVDGATGTAVIGAIALAEVLLDIKG